MNRKYRRLAGASALALALAVTGCNGHSGPTSADLKELSTQCQQAYQVAGEAQRLTVYGPELVNLSVKLVNECYKTGWKPCQEDEPCWDCDTMGNRVCGPDQG